MKKRLVIVTIMFLAALMLSSGGRTLRASGHETHYTVTYICECGYCYGLVVGEWDVDCDGNWSGWGEVPYSDPNCTQTTMDIGVFCGPDYP